MPSSSDIKAGGAFVEVHAKDFLAADLAKINAKMQAVMQKQNAKIAADLQRVQEKQASAIGALFTKYLGFGAIKAAVSRGMSYIQSAVSSFAAMGQELAKSSAITGVGADTLAAWHEVASDAGASTDELDKAIRSANGSIAEAVTGGTAAADAFRQMGLDAGALFKLSPEQRFLAISKALAKIKDAGLRQSLSSTLLGKSGISLDPLIAGGGAAQLAAAREQSAQRGTSLSNDQIRIAREFGDVLGVVGKQLTAFGYHVASVIGPTLTSVFKMFSEAMGEINRIIKSISTAMLALPELWDPRSFVNMLQALFAQMTAAWEEAIAAVVNSIIGMINFVGSKIGMPAITGHASASTARSAADALWKMWQTTRSVAVMQRVRTGPSDQDYGYGGAQQMIAAALGTFSSPAAAMMGRSGPVANKLDDISSAARATEKNTKIMADKLQSMGTTTWGP